MKTKLFISTKKVVRTHYNRSNNSEQIFRCNIHFVSVCMTEVPPLFVVEFLHRHKMNIFNRWKIYLCLSIYTPGIGFCRIVHLGYTVSGRIVLYYREKNRRLKKVEKKKIIFNLTLTLERSYFFIFRLEKYNFLPKI